MLGPKTIREAAAIPKQTFKVDVQIVAVAIANGSDVIVTNDFEAFRKIAQNRIRVSEVPNIPEQQELFTGERVDGT